MTSKTRRSRPGFSSSARFERGGNPPPGDVTPPTSPPREPSAWLRGRLAQVAVRVRALDIDIDHGNWWVMPLGKPSTPGTREDRSCDRCGQYVPDDATLVMLTAWAAPRLLVGGGLCVPCAIIEQP